MKGCREPPGGIRHVADQDIRTGQATRADASVRLNRSDAILEDLVRLLARNAAREAVDAQSAPSRNKNGNSHDQEQ